MNTFNLEKAKQGEPVITKDGKSVRIICFDRKFNVNGKDGSIIALVLGKSGKHEMIVQYNSDGTQTNYVSNLDLQMKNS